MHVHTCLTRWEHQLQRHACIQGNLCVRIHIKYAHSHMHTEYTKHILRCVLSMHTCTYIDICTLLKRSLKFLPTTAHSDPLLTQTAQLIPGSRGKGDTTWGGPAEKPTEGSSSREEENQLNLTAHSAFLTGPYLPPPHFQCKLGAAGRPNEYPEELRESQKRSIRTDEL